MDGTSHCWVTNTVPVYDVIEEFNVDLTRNNNMKKEETKTNGVGSPEGTRKTVVERICGSLSLE